MGFKKRLASIAGNIMFIVMMFGTGAQKNFATAHIMWWYVLIFATLGALSFADRYSLDRHEEIARYSTDVPDRLTKGLSTKKACSRSTGSVPPAPDPPSRQLVAPIRLTVLHF